MAIPPFIAADATTKQFPTSVRQQQAANLKDVRTPEGGALNSATGGLRSRTRVRTPLRIADVDLTTYNSAGLAKATNVLGASTAGTQGRFWAPLWDGRSFRASATIRCTPGTTGSLSVFGLSSSAAGVDPGQAADWIGVGYVQGVGVVLRRSNATGNDSVLIADSALTDGQQVTVTLLFDGRLHSAGNPLEFLLQAIVTAADGTVTAKGQMFPRYAWLNGTGSFVARTNVTAAFTDLQVSPDMGADTLAPSALVLGGYTSLASAERMAVRLPARPNGKLVLALHGRGVDPSVMFDANQYNSTWRALLASGYTIAMPNLGGNLWGNATAQSYIAACRDAVCAAFGLDRKVFVWGASMGGGAALTAISKGTLGPEGVQAAYLAQPVCDIAAVYADNSSNFTEIPQLYPDQASMDAYSPIKQPAASYAGVPMLFVASPSDGTVAKAKNTDPMRALIGANAPTALLVASGGHEDASEFQTAACLSWFQQNA